MPLLRPLVLACAVAALATGCGSGPGTAPPTGVDELEIPTSSPDPADFVAGIDNPWLPLQPGNRWVYRSTGDKPETVTVTVTPETREVAGVTTTVVRDVVTDAEGDVLEDTFDWFAQDRAGNVWYFGEDTTERGERGGARTAGSWEAGVDGARAGLAMPAQPRVGDGYEQEHRPGVAEDRAEVLALDGEASVPFGDFDALLVTEDSTPLEPGTTERKFYARGVGLVLEDAGAGAGERSELVSFSRG